MNGSLTITAGSVSAESTLNHTKKAIARAIMTPSKTSPTISMGYAIKIISHKQARKIIRYSLPRGLYIFPYGKYWAALDNSAGDTWTRTFDDIEAAKMWLRSY